MHVDPIVPLIPTPPLRTCEVCVTIPVRNEQQRLPATLRALAYQLDLRGGRLDPARYEVLVLANNCTDDTVAVAEHVARSFSNVPIHIIERELPAPLAHVGYARRLLMDEAERRLCFVGRPGGLIAMTDGDTRPAPTWIAAMLHEAAHGADGIGGNIVTEASDVAAMEPGERWFHLHDVRYKHMLTRSAALLVPDPCDPWPRHHHHTGASLALTAAWYRRVGGIPALPSSEDVALYTALIQKGAHFRHSPTVSVSTSTRRIGRARDGMADTLLHWGKMARSNQSLLVESWEAVAGRLFLRDQLRQHWQDAQNKRPASARTLGALAEQAQVDQRWLAEQLVTTRSLDVLLGNVAQRSHATPAPLVEVGAAIRGLESWLARA